MKNCVEFPPGEPPLLTNSQQPMSQAEPCGLDVPIMSIADGMSVVSVVPASSKSAPAFARKSRLASVVPVFWNWFAYVFPPVKPAGGEAISVMQVVQVICPFVLMLVKPNTAQFTIVPEEYVSTNKLFVADSPVGVTNVQLANFAPPIKKPDTDPVPPIYTQFVNRPPPLPSRKLPPDTLPSTMQLSTATVAATLRQI